MWYYCAQYCVCSTVYFLFILVKILLIVGQSQPGSSLYFMFLLNEEGKKLKNWADDFPEYQLKLVM